MTRAIADTSIFITQEVRRELRELSDEITVSVITIASCFARIAAHELDACRKLRRHAWIAATALHHGATVVTQDTHFTTFPATTVIRA